MSRRRFLRQISAAAVAAVAVPRSRALDAPANGKRLGIALVGLGNYAEYHLLPAIRQSKYWKLAGVVTGSKKKGETWARQYGFSAKNVFSYDTMHRLADCPEVDVVYVVTPNALHAANAIAAAKAGKHVICEKPMAVSVAQCDAMIKACKEANVRLMIGYRLHYVPYHMEFCRLAKDSALGPFMKIASDNSFDMGDVPFEEANWRVRKDLAGGGPLMDMGVYVIQAVCMAKVEVPPAAVTAKFGEVTRPRLFREVEQSLSWIEEYADGARAECYTSYCDQKSHIRAQGAKGWAEIPYPAFYYDTSGLETSAGQIDLPRPNHQVAQMEGMALEILENRPSRAPGEMGRRDIVIVEAIYASARSGKRVEVRV
jgi:glucose-fructose oxidoreductase